MRSSILSQCKELSIGMICSISEVAVLLRVQESFAIIGYEIFLFLAVSLGKVSYSSIINNVQEM